MISELKMISSKEQFSSFVSATYRYLQASGLPSDVRLSAVRELMAKSIANKPSNKLIEHIENCPIPVDGTLCKRVASAIQEAYGLEIPSQAWRWPLPASFKLNPSERISIWQEAFQAAFDGQDIDGMWRDTFFSIEPYIKPMGDGYWAVCNRSPVRFGVCCDVLGAKWLAHRPTDNSIADDRSGRGEGDLSFQLGLTALWKNDYKLAFDHLQKAADLGHPLANFNLGWMFSEGLGMAQDFTRASVHYQAAADRGISMAHHNIARLHLAGGPNFAKSIPDAIRHFELAAEGKVAASIGCLGMIYLNGNGVPADRSRAVKLLAQAVKLGDDHSVNALATVLDMENGGVSTPETFAMYRIAARSARELNQLTPIYNLGLCFLSGNGTEQNLTKARRLFRVAAVAGEPDAAFNLGLMYLNGEGATLDPDEAKLWFERAADHDQMDAINALGSIEFNGLCGDCNYSRAWELFSHAADLGSAFAMVNQARSLVFGLGVERDMGRASDLLYRAEDLGAPHAREARIQWEVRT